MTEPHSPGQTAIGSRIPSQHHQTPASWPSIVPEAAPPRRSRAGLIVTLVLVGVLVLCGGIAGTAVYVSTREFSTGAMSPDEAVVTYLTGVYLHQEASVAEKDLCQSADPTALVTRKIKDARAITDRYDAAYSWSVLVVSDQTATAATVATVLTAASDVYRTTTSLTIRTIHSNGWWVCDVTSSPN